MEVDKNILNSLEENDIFKKLRANYIYNKHLIYELTNKNSELKIRIINKGNNILRRGNSQENQMNYIRHKIKKECSLNISHNEENKNNSSDMNNIELNNYVENKLKLNNRDYFMTKQLNGETKKKIKLMIQMILNSNNINKEDIINLFMNNLLDYYKSVEIFCSDYLKIINSSNIKILKNYFKSIFFDEEKLFNVNNVYNEILSFYDEEITSLGKINILDMYNKHKKFILKILKKCKNKDCLDTGFIEFDYFKNTFNEFMDKNDSEFDKELLLNALIYNMKKNDNNEQIGLLLLSYQNLCKVFKINDLLKINLDEENEKTSDYLKTSKRKRNNFK